MRPTLRVLRGGRDRPSSILHGTRLVPQVYKNEAAEYRISCNSLGLAHLYLVN